MMHILDRLFTRRRRQPGVTALARPFQQRMALACRELDEAEQAIAAELDLPQPPRLLLIDEERAAILTPADRIDTPHHDN